MIDGREMVSSALSGIQNQRLIPSFPIDTLVRNRVVLAAAEVLDEVLREDIVVISANKSISLDPAERLLPDVLMRSTSGRFLLVELKRAKQTAREAITELLAYDHELRNNLPFLPGRDVCLVIIATEFTTLLDHSIAHVVGWEGRKVLCLLVSEIEGERRLSVHLPSAWHAVGQVGLPGDAIMTTTLALYSAEPGEQELELLWLQVQDAMGLIVRDAERGGAHGFVMLVRDGWGLSDVPFFLVVGMVNPFFFCDQALEYEFVPTPGATPLVEHLRSDVGLDLRQTSFVSMVSGICERALKHLSRFCSPSIEAPGVNWADTRKSLQHRGFIEDVDSWGIVNEYLTDLVMRPSFYDGLYGHLATSRLALLDPQISIPLIDALAGLPALPEGEIGCEHALELGIRLGQLLSLVSTAVGEEELRLSTGASLQWAQLGIFPDLMEIYHRVRGAEGIVDPPSIVLSPRCEKDLGRVLESIEPFIKWIHGQFLAGNPVHQRFFALGLDGHALVSEYLSEGLSAEERQKHSEGVARHSVQLLETFRASLSGIVKSERTQAAEKLFFSAYIGRDPSRSGELEEEGLLGQIGESRHVSNFREALPHILNSVTPGLFHVLKPFVHGQLDMGWISEQLWQARRRGSLYPALIIDANGGIGVGTIPEEIGKVLRKVDMETEVMVVWHYAGAASSITIEGWCEVGAVLRGERPVFDVTLSIAEGGEEE